MSNSEQVEEHVNVRSVIGYDEISRFLDYGLIHSKSSMDGKNNLIDIGLKQIEWVNNNGNIFGYDSANYNWIIHYAMSLKDGTLFSYDNLEIEIPLIMLALSLGYSDLYATVKQQEPWDNLSRLIGVNESGVDIDLIESINMVEMMDIIKTVFLDNYKESDVEVDGSFNRIVVQFAVARYQFLLEKGVDASRVACVAEDKNNAFFMALVGDEQISNAMTKRTIASIFFPYPEYWDNAGLTAVDFLGISDSDLSMDFIETQATWMKTPLHGLMHLDKESRINNNYYLSFRKKLLLNMIPHNRILSDGVYWMINNDDQYKEYWSTKVLEVAEAVILLDKSPVNANSAIIKAANIYADGREIVTDYIVRELLSDRYSRDDSVITMQLFKIKNREQLIKAILPYMLSPTEEQGHKIMDSIKLPPKLLNNFPASCKRRALDDCIAL